MGYYYGDDERVDTILRKAIKRGESVSVQDKMEKIGGSNCYFIKALTKRGEFTIWLDPEKDYNIVKAISRKLLLTLTMILLVPLFRTKL